MTSNALLIFLLLASSQGSVQGADKSCMAYTAKREAAGESLRAIRAVSEVVAHRMKKQHKSCLKIVSEKHQFSWWRKNVKMKNTPEWLTRYNNSRTLRPVLPSCADHFFSTNIKPPRWTKSMRKVAKIGRMVYYCSVPIGTT